MANSRTRETQNDIIPIYYYCINCWGNSYFDFQRHELYGKNMRQIRDLVQERHSKFNPCQKPDVRLTPIPK